LASTTHVEIKEISTHPRKFTDMYLAITGMHANPRTGQLPQIPWPGQPWDYRARTFIT
jgi:hypothetical protein